MTAIARSIGGEALSTRAAMKMEDTLQAFAVRAACFIGELEVPFSEQFDGHDFAATHVIAYVGEEPVGTVRLRWFQSFAMPERLAVIQRFRGHGIGQSLIEHARSLALGRGCSMLYAQVPSAQAKYLEKHGWRRLPRHDGNPATRQNIALALAADPAHPLPEFFRVTASILPAELKSAVARPLVYAGEVNPRETGDDVSH